MKGLDDDQSSTRGWLKRGIREQTEEQSETSASLASSLEFPLPTRALPTSAPVIPLGEPLSYAT